ncbi:alpha/beta hydrolase [Mycobacterium sp. E802]|uniref:alpha/beta hydrolase n=1 Tax=Mycobacterium sp. E802 TaxID=1834152 RepID=UPI0007FEF798|nr:alpha/beta hydrolase [Mycobacterium sp. E802]OBG83087.1 alpha/beta hydrolase [Mycobacterium sp. E802]
MTYTELTFYSAGERCSAWHFTAAGDGFTGPSGRPVVVMAHGFGGTKDSGLQPFAERFSEAGLDVLAFDYRGFGASEGQPRQSVSVERQMADYTAAITAAQGLPGVDPRRVVLWGSSFSGSHVLRVAAQCADVAAVIGMTPLTSGLAASRAAVAHRDVASALRWTLAGVKSRVAVARGGRPTLMPLAAKPGEAGALALEGAYDSYTAIAGPTWRNEVDSAIGMELVQIRTGAAAKALKCPVLIQIADFDRFVPANSVMKTAVQARAQVHHYPCDHFDVWPGHDWFETAADDQVKFLTRTLVTA